MFGHIIFIALEGHELERLLHEYDLNAEYANKKYENIRMDKY